MINSRAGAPFVGPRALAGPLEPLRPGPFSGRDDVARRLRALVRRWRITA
ncbi:hypothetical protein ACFYPK_17385 [Streptomyces halstedii]|nr:hypothetical protein [Streptomyces griseolus]